MDFTSEEFGMPLMVLDGDQQEFDYGAFLQEDDDADYMGEDSSASTSTNNPGITPPGQSPLGAGASPGVATRPGSSALVRSTSEIQRQKQRLERRGHTKSRRGCFNCKRRRIKVGSPLQSFTHSLAPGSYISLVSRNETSVRSLCQDRSKLRVSFGATGCSSGTRDIAWVHPNGH